MSPLSSKVQLKLLVITLLSLGLVMTAVYLIHYDHSPTSIPLSSTANQQAIDCSKAAPKNLASITEQTQQPDQCLYLGCSGFFQ